MDAALVEQLRTIPVYSRLSEPELRQLAVVSQSRLVQRGEQLFSAGDPADHFYMIVRGRMKICRPGPADKEVILALLGPGDPVGGAAVYLERPFPANAIALEDTVCVAIPRAEFYNLIDTSPALVRGILLGMTLRLVELTSHINTLAGSRVEPRFARLFLKLGERMGRQHEEGLCVPMKLSRQELADLTGTTVETCIRTMSRWGKDGVVITREDSFLIPDPDALRELAEA